MKKLQLIAKIKGYPPNIPVGYPDDYDFDSEWHSVFNDYAAYGKYGKYVNIKNIGEPQCTGGPSPATIQETKNSWSNKQLLKTTKEELKDLLEAVERNEAWWNKYSNMSIYEFLYAIDPVTHPKGE